MVLDYEFHRDNNTTGKLVTDIRDDPTKKPKPSDIIKDATPIVHMQRIPPRWQMDSFYDKEYHLPVALWIGTREKYETFGLEHINYKDEKLASTRADFTR